VGFPVDVMSELLRVILFLPLAAALLLHGSRQWMRVGTLVVTLVVLGLTADLVARYSQAAGQTGFAAETDASRLKLADSGIDIHFSIGIDGLSLWLFTLTSLLMVVAVLVGWEAIDKRASLYYRLLLILETGMLGVFVARDIILFYIFFEFTLIPLFFLIGLWGGEQRRHAAAKFFLFTLAGSLLTFLGLLAIVLWCYFNSDADPALRSLTFSIPDLTESLRQAALRGHPMELWLQIGIFLALFAGFAIKTPLFPLHTWLPLAHVEAPTAGSVILAGVLLKVGTYGFARFNLPMLPEASAVLMPWLMWISLAGVLYGALAALAQSDIKRLVAYSSVSHLGLCMLGLFALDRLSIQGGVLQMVSHGLATGGLFAVVGMIYERFHTREIADFGDLARRMPVLACFALLLTLSSIALPLTAGFAAEFPLLLGVFQRGWATVSAAHAVQLRTIAVLSLGGAVLGAWYMLWMYQRVFFTSPRQHGGKRNVDPVRDLSLREVFCLAPLVVMILWIGLQPRFFLDRMGHTLDDLMKPAMQAVEKEGERGERRGERGERNNDSIHHSSFIIHHLSLR
ncbi:MAG: NADH-quinone oxidoreductase subunit M, partial [Thermoguttaceae bacterium]